MSNRVLFGLAAGMTVALLVGCVPDSVSNPGGGGGDVAALVGGVLGRDATVLDGVVGAVPFGGLTTDAAGMGVVAGGTAGGGVRLAIGSSSVMVGLPVGSGATAVGVRSGVVAYDGGNGSLSAVIGSDHGVAVATIITGSSAPTSYRFDLSLPSGAKLVAGGLGDGGAEIVDSAGATLGWVKAPWAHDDNGVEVSTRLVVESSTRLVQIVDHTTTAGVLYPVLADPAFVGNVLDAAGRVADAAAPAVSAVFQTGKCVYEIGKVVVPAAKVARLVRESGGVAKVAELLWVSRREITTKGVVKWIADHPEVKDLAKELIGYQDVLDACFPKPTIADSPPQSTNTFWTGSVSLEYAGNGSSLSVDGDMSLLLTRSSPGLASWTYRGAVLDDGYLDAFANGQECGPFGANYYIGEISMRGVGSGGEAAGGQEGPVPVSVMYESGPVPGYRVSTDDKYLNSKVGIPATRIIPYLACPDRPFVEHTDSDVVRLDVVPPQSWIIPSAADDDFVLSGSTSYSYRYYSPVPGRADVIASYRLRRNDCTGVSDTDSDGYDDCVEFDAGTDWSDPEAHPGYWDEDHDGVPDPQDWCPRESDLTNPPTAGDPTTTGCPAGRGPGVVGMVPTDWRGGTVGYSLGFVARGTFPYARSSTFRWDFGDGTGTVTGSVLNHTYAAPGSYKVRLTVTDTAGRTFTQPPQTLTFTGDPIVDFAPEVRLTRTEPYWPMDPATFISDSSLVWTRTGVVPTGAGCEMRTEDHVVAAQADSTRVGSGPGAHDQYVNWNGDVNACPPGNDQFTAADFTRPYDHAANRQGLPDSDGFHLDFDSSKNPTAFTQVPIWTEAKSAGSESVVTYWFFYGDDKADVSVGDAFGSHEGDWEHVNVHLDSTLKVPVSVGYFWHDDKAAPRPFAGPEVKRSEWLHPIVYSAQGSHGSYWSAGCFAANPVTRDHTADDGPTWQAWKLPGGIQGAASQPWYGFGGAWGRVGDLADAGLHTTTGPLGPSDYKSTDVSNPSDYRADPPTPCD